MINAVTTIRLAFAALAAGAAAPKVARLEMYNYQEGWGSYRSSQAEELKKLESEAKIETAIEKMATIKENIKATVKYSPNSRAYQNSDLSATEYEKALAKQTAHCDSAVKELKDIMSLLRNEITKSSELKDASNLYKEAYKCSSAICKPSGNL